MGKPKILITVNSYLPGFKSGGPVQSISCLADLLSKDYIVTVITNDRDTLSESAYPNIRTNARNPINGYDVIYVKPGIFNKCLAIYKWIIEIKPNVIYLNSFFNPWFTLFVLLISKTTLTQKIGYKVLLAPRGEFSPGALNLKRKKKSIVLFIIRKLNLLENVCFHFTNEQERKFFYKTVDWVERKSYFIASNIKTMKLIPFEKLVDQFAKKRENSLKICFISRIVPKKNLHYAIETVLMFNNLQQDITLNIYGPPEDKNYWDLCQNLIMKAAPNVKINYWGAVDNRDIWRVFTSNDIFYFPTNGENFGHVIIESLAFGCPVLISDQTPWEDLEQKGCGWIFSLNENARAFEVLKYAASLSSFSYLPYRNQAFEYAEVYFSNENQQNFEKFLFGIQSLSKPAT
ncbi:Glycosyltransferase involved in cell wall bisynthesis [Parapedobacter composti]|uniref:Glycosyltransferase involved in cell wall bisynthesis n=1 Tax=Parapedobacter composti TaxID=623281 RepID=A0A1I1IRL9_9SPHI|nr:glycosyltransferase [Parapedobacter composti]SFC38927.1 Glycosyltransferase involved in cell wall bisynthesis [Parapedobacter composti]